MARKKKNRDTNKVFHAGSLNKAMEVLSKGYNTHEAKKALIEYRKGEKLSVTDGHVNNILSEANKRLCLDYGKDKQEVIAIHVERYNKDIDALLNIYRRYVEREANGDFEDYDWKQLNRIKEHKISSLYQALSSMYSKEKVLQMHSKSFQIYISNKVNVIIEEEKPNYDLSKLTGEQKLDFLNLILKAKQNEFEAGSVVLRVEENKEETLDIEHEVVKESINIDKIQIEAPDPSLMVPPKTGTALLDVNEKLRLSLQQKAIQEFKKAGSKTIEQDEKILKNGKL